MNEPILICKDVNKSYKAGVPVLENFNCSLAGGKIIGLLGPNGCGKSTLMKLICGLLVPDSGEITVCGETDREKINALVSYLPERSYFSTSMRVCELVAYFEDFYSDFDANIAYRMLSDLRIDRDAKLKTLSKGTKEKVQLIMVMARRARLYLLDEPIAGVDPAARDYILQTIIGSYNTEATVVITTHLIYDIEPILDEFAFLGFKGQIALSGNADEIRAQYSKSLNELFREVFRCYGNY